MDKITVTAYNQIAELYDQETTEFWELFPRTFFDKFIELSGKNILDVGSGPGRDGLIMQQAGLNVTCLDASQAMVEMCSRRGLPALLGDFNHLEFPDHSFDGVWAYTSLLHVAKSAVDQPLHEIKRVLKPNGYFALGMIEGATEGYQEKQGHECWFSHYTRGELEQLLTKHGFEKVYFEAFQPRSKNYLNFIARRQTS